MKRFDWRWMIRTAILLCALSLSSACNTPAGKAATYKAKQISPVHDTKVEKATDKVPDVKKDDKKGLLKR